MVTSFVRPRRLAPLGVVVFIVLYILFSSDTFLTTTNKQPTTSPSQKLFRSKKPSQIPLGNRLNNHDACNVWPESSPPAQLKGKVTDTAGAVVGDPALLGDAKQCVFASSRFHHFGRYAGDAAVDWSEVEWGAVQKRCARATFGQQEVDRNDYSMLGPPTDKILSSPHVWALPPNPRTAVVIRTWENYTYTPETLSWLRALIAETALHSRGAYAVFLLVNVRDKTIPLHESSDVYKATLREFVPAEFHSIAYLYSESLLEQWYPRIPLHNAQDQMYQALQILAAHHDEFEFFWQLEMDARFTGHVGDALDRIARFARDQPRKHLWERNGAFFVPDAHGESSYEQFSNRVAADLAGTQHEDGIWGAVSTADFTAKGPPAAPPSQTTWGVGEEAELITLLPMVDPIGTGWVYEEWVYGFTAGTSLPRRVAPISMTRTSRRLLRLISEAQRNHGQWLVSEGTPETFALLHGLKAVYAPHAVRFVAGTTPAELDRLLNSGPPENRAGGSAPSFCYNRSMQLVEPLWTAASFFYLPGPAENIWKEYVDGKCVGPMILHPVKND